MSHYQEKSPAPEIKGPANLQMYHNIGLQILNLDLKGLGRDRESEGGARRQRNVESSEAGLFPERAHLECCVEVRLFVACFICTWPANSPFVLFVVLHY